MGGNENCELRSMKDGARNAWRHTEARAPSSELRVMGYKISCARAAKITNPKIINDAVFRARFSDGVASCSEFATHNFFSGTQVPCIGSTLGVYRRHPDFTLIIEEFLASRGIVLELISTWA